MAEGGFDLRQNFNFSDSDSEGEEDGINRELRERLLVFGIDGDVISSEHKDSLEVGLQSNHISRENGEAEATSQGSRTDNSPNSEQTSSCPVLYDNVSNRRRTRSFTFGRLVRRLSRNRRRTDDAYREIEIGAVDGRMLTAGLETAHNSSVTENQSSENLDSRRRRQRPQSTVVLRPRTSTNAVDRRNRRPNSFIGRVCKLFDSTEDGRETPSGSIFNSESSPSDSSAANTDPGTPTITFPIGVNELVAIRRERARLRVEQTRIEYHIIPDLLSVSNCPWYWGKINRFEAERVLQGQSDGTFLLRDSAQHHYLFSVSFRRYFRTYHARIEQWKHYYSFDKPSDFSFRSKTLCDLLEHYSQAEQCMYYEPLLLHPFPRKSVLSLQHLCRANICNQTTFQGVEELPLPKSLKLYLREYHYKVAVKKMADKGTQTVPPRKIFGICRN